MENGIDPRNNEEISAYNRPSTSSDIISTATNKIKGSKDTICTPKESISNDGISPGLVEKIIRGDPLFDEQLQKYCDGQQASFPSPRLDTPTSSQETEKGGAPSCNVGNRLLVKQEVLAKIREDLAEDYQPLFRENDKKYSTNSVATSHADLNSAIEHHCRLRSPKMRG